MKMKNSTYDILKKVVQIGLPALITLYVALAKIWNFPMAAEVAGTLGAIATFLGALLGISTYNYNLEELEESEEVTDDAL